MNNFESAASPPCGVCDKTACPPRHVMRMRGNPKNGGWCDACCTKTPATGKKRPYKQRSAFSRHANRDRRKKTRQKTAHKLNERGHFYIDAAGHCTTISDSTEDDPDFDPDLDGTGTAGARAHSGYISPEAWADLANRAAVTMHDIETGTTDLRGRNTGTHLRSYKQAMATRRTRRDLATGCAI